MNLENQATHTTAQTLEQLSAWMDGELAGAELDQLLASLPALDGAEHCYASAHSYLAIGEIMRSPASGATSSLSFLSTLSARIAQEPPLRAVEQQLAGEVTVPAVQPAVVALPAQEAANQSVFRWKLVAGLASVAAVAMVGWNSLILLQGPAAGKAGAQLASAPAGVTQLASANTNAQGLVQMPVTVGQNATIMLRDPRLDELLAARGQIGGTANLQMPASFLRNATFNAEKKSGGCADQTSRLC